jgi:diguanylate cyclase (GGDEF)-like protein/PAS domain S-box-containing protein
MDVMMPEMDGFSACAELRRLPGGLHTPVLMMTGLDDIASINRAYEAGATDFITKPINWLILQHRILYVLRASRLFQELNKSRICLAQAQHIASVGHWEWHQEANEIEWSDEVYRILQLEPRENRLTIEKFQNFVHPDDRDKVKTAFGCAIQKNIPFDMDTRIILPDGSERMVHQQADQALAETGKSRWMMGTIQDITERKQAEERISFLAYYDSLTELPNRTLFKQRLEEELSRARRNERLLAVLFIDVDNFKLINDTFGHTVGDELLKNISQRLNHYVRSGDCISRPVGATPNNTVARLGGDEYTMLLTDFNKEKDAAVVAQRILNELSKPFRIGEHDIYITVSIGITLYPSDGEDVETLLKNADLSMYEAKDRGKNNFQFFNKLMKITMFERLSLENRLRKALHNKEFTLFYQPKMDVANKQIIGMEALVRWQSPERGLVMPKDFIPVAEKSDLILQIGEWVLRTACKQNKVWQMEGFDPICISVNISSREIMQQNLVKIVDGVLRDTGLEARYLELELTERMLMHQEAIESLYKLKAMGVQISIDDFGTGYSSLNCLKNLPIDIIKIDSSFVKDISTSVGDASIVKTIIRMAASLNLKVIAEGVETEKQLNFLRDESCDEVQGYLFSTPLPAEQFKDLLKKQKVYA